MKAALNLLKGLCSVMGNEFVCVVMYEDGSGHLQDGAGEQISGGDFSSLDELEGTIIHLIKTGDVR